MSRYSIGSSYLPNPCLIKIGIKTIFTVTWPTEPPPVSNIFFFTRDASKEIFEVQNLSAEYEFCCP